MVALLLTLDPGVMGDGHTAQRHALPSIARTLALEARFRHELAGRYSATVSIRVANSIRRPPVFASGGKACCDRDHAHNRTVTDERHSPRFARIEREALLAARGHFHSGWEMLRDADGLRGTWGPSDHEQCNQSLGSHALPQ